MPTYVCLASLGNSRKTRKSLKLQDASATVTAKLPGRLRISCRSSLRKSRRIGTSEGKESRIIFGYAATFVTAGPKRSAAK